MDKTKRVPEGLCLYVKKDYDAKILKKINIVNDDYFLQVNVVQLQCKVIMGVYFSPRCPQKIKNSTLREALNVCPQNEVVIGGDFNCDKELNVIVNKSFSRLPIGATNKHGSQIDHIYLKSDIQTYTAGANYAYYSDYKCTFFIWNDCNVQSKADKDKDIDSKTESNNHVAIVEKPFDTHQPKTTIRIIDFLNTNCSNELISFLSSNRFATINSNQNIQKGLSCGYICANLSSKFFSMIQHNDKEWINCDVTQCAFPNVSLFNEILDIPSLQAEVLSSEQILKLAVSLTHDHNIDWLYTMDVNLFKTVAMNNFQDLNLPSLNDKKWAIFLYK